MHTESYQVFTCWNGRRTSGGIAEAVDGETIDAALNIPFIGGNLRESESAALFSGGD
ncbi:hypothetical protein WN982_27580 [Paraburkholderia sp. IMGN_8]|uniref:hypothetical protein n=1 Tax=Paraburkholderia sp. IMGN_8 TaxID=3136564 RepID=UPI0031018430